STNTMTASPGSADANDHSEEGDDPQKVDPPVSARNRGHRRPGTGAGSRNCQPGTGATMSSMNRSRTKPACCQRWASDAQLAPGERRALPKEGSHQRFCRSPNGISNPCRHLERVVNRVRPVLSRGELFVFDEVSVLPGVGSCSPVAHGS